MLSRAAIAVAVFGLLLVAMQLFSFSNTTSINFGLQQSTALQSQSREREDPAEKIGNNTLFKLDCSSIAEVSDLGVKWFQNKMAKDYTDTSSHCSGRQGLRRCHDVYADTGDGMQLRACQWRFPYGPCEDMRPEYALPVFAVCSPFPQ